MPKQRTMSVRSSWWSLLLAVLLLVFVCMCSVTDGQHIRYQATQIERVDGLQPRMQLKIETFPKLKTKKEWIRPELPDKPIQVVQTYRLAVPASQSNAFENAPKCWCEKPARCIQDPCGNKRPRKCSCKQAYVMAKYRKERRRKDCKCLPQVPVLCEEDPCKPNPPVPCVCDVRPFPKTQQQLRKALPPTNIALQIPGAQNDVCQCLREPVCACRPDPNSAPLTSNQVYADESDFNITEKINVTQAVCDCLQQLLCPCRTEYTRPEIKPPTPMSSECTCPEPKPCDFEPCPEPVPCDCVKTTFKATALQQELPWRLARAGIRVGDPDTIDGRKVGPAAAGAAPQTLVIPLTNSFDKCECLHMIDCPCRPWYPKAYGGTPSGISTLTPVEKPNGTPKGLGLPKPPEMVIPEIRRADNTACGPICL